jgi:hypothetical protein
MIQAPLDKGSMLFLLKPEEIEFGTYKSTSDITNDSRIHLWTVFSGKVILRICKEVSSWLISFEEIPKELLFSIRLTEWWWQSRTSNTVFHWERTRYFYDILQIFVGRAEHSEHFPQITFFREGNSEQARSIELGISSRGRCHCFY